MRSTILLFVLAITGTWNVGSVRAVELEAGDRIVWVGGAFIERMQANGYVETMLTSAYPDRTILHRNLGWSGDTVFGDARAVFGTPADGFQRLERDLLDAKPTVIIASYGANEAHAGEAGLGRFTDGLQSLFKLFDRTNARVIILSPRPYERIGPPLPDPEPYNRQLRAYCAVLRQAATSQGYTYIDLQDLRGGQLTDNGVHLTPFGYWRLASRLATELGIPTTRWHLDLNHAQSTYSATDALVQDWERLPDGFKLSVIDRRLPSPPPPPDAPTNAQLLRRHGSIRIQGLPPGEFSLTVDGQPLLSALSTAWATGLDLPWRAGTDQAEKLRQAIVAKDLLYFHRHRPQNETYLFLFRKHEQGNNAVEIPQFDPLIAERESEIATLRKPQAHVYELHRK